MLVFQISTYAIVSTALTIVAARAGSEVQAAEAFSWILPLYLLCASVVIFSANCTHNLCAKYTWFILKVILCAIACHIHRAHLRFDVMYFLTALCIGAAYIATTDIQTVYGCSLYSFEYTFTGLFTSLVYGILGRVMCKLRN